MFDTDYFQDLQKSKFMKLCDFKLFLFLKRFYNVK